MKTHTPYSEDKDNRHKRRFQYARSKSETLAQQERGQKMCSHIGNLTPAWSGSLIDNRENVIEPLLTDQS